MRHAMFVPIMFAIAVLKPAELAAQGDSAQAPMIIVSASATKKIPADRATVLVSVETIAPTSAAAGDQNARVFKAVVDALRTAGVRPNDMTTAGFSVRQNMVYHETLRREVAEGFLASNAIRIETAELDKLGAYIDAALKGGATRVYGVQFSSTAMESTRRAALAEAIANAKTDAEVMSKASGGTLGRLIEVSTERESSIRVRGISSYMRLGEVVVSPTDIMPREIEVSSEVITRWQLRLP